MDGHVPRDDDVGGDEHVVSDAGVVSDMVTAPQCRVVADSNEGLDCVVLKDEAVLADVVTVENGRARTDVARESISGGSASEEAFASDAVAFFIGERDEEVALIRGELAGEGLKRDDWQTHEVLSFQELGIDGECDDLAIGVGPEVVQREFGNLSGPEHDKGSHSLNASRRR